MHGLIMLIAYSRDVPDKLSQSFTLIIGPILRLTNETLLIRTITLVVLYPKQVICTSGSVSSSQKPFSCTT